MFCSFKNFETEDAHAIAVAFIDYYADILHTEEVPFRVSSRNRRIVKTDEA